MLSLLLSLILQNNSQQPVTTTKYNIPFRVTETKHILVRAKINNKGPFNFIIDTGAPTIYFAPKMAEKAGIKPDKNGWGTLNKLELEGGAISEKQLARIEEPPQLSGMNTLGILTARLDGVLGYTYLANFRIEIDLTQTTMAWTKQKNATLEITPPAFNKTHTPPSAEQTQMAELTKMMSNLLKRDPAQVVTRGFWGIELEGDKTGAKIKAVLKDSPAETAGLKIGDVITKIGYGEKETLVMTTEEIFTALEKVASNESIRLTIKRKSQQMALTLKTGSGGL